MSIPLGVEGEVRSPRAIPRTVCRILTIALLNGLCVGAALAAAPVSSGLYRGPSSTLYYEIHGDPTATRGAIPLVILNGGPGVSHMYMMCSGVWDDLARRRPVVFYDPRGTGRSPALRGSQSCTLADQVEDLDGLLRKLHFDRADLLGHSMGGYIAMAYAALHPSRVAHLVICDSAAPKFSDTLFLFEQMYPDITGRQQAFAFAEELGDSAAARASFEEYVGMLFYSSEKRDEYRALHLPYEYSRQVNQAIIQDVARFDLGPELAKFRFPVLVVTGRHDFNVAPVVAFKIHRAIPGSQIAVFESSGHLPFFEEPEAFRERLEAFLATPAKAPERSPTGSSSGAASDTGGRRGESEARGRP